MTGTIKDEIIERSGAACNKYNSKPLRLVHFWDSTTGNEYHFLTNNTKWKASLVANIYKQRWHIEVFFKHLKQRLKVSTFIGTSENAVMIQIWTSLIGILLLKYLQKKAKYDWNLSNLVAFIRMNIFVKINIWKWIDDGLLPSNSLSFNDDFLGSFTNLTLEPFYKAVSEEMRPTDLRTI